MLRRVSKAGALSAMRAKLLPACIHVVAYQAEVVLGGRRRPVSTGESAGPTLHWRYWGNSGLARVKWRHSHLTGVDEVLCGVECWRSG